MRFILNEGDSYKLRREAALWYKDEVQIIPVDPTVPADHVDLRDSSTYNEDRTRIPYIIFAQGRLRDGKQGLSFGPPQDDTVFRLPLEEILTLVRLLKGVGIVS